MMVRTVLDLHVLPDSGTRAFHYEATCEAFHTTAETDDEIRTAAIAEIASYISIEIRNGWLSDKLVMSAMPTQLLIDDDGLFREITF